MALKILISPQIELASVNFSDHCSQLEMNTKKAAVDATNFSGGGKRTLGGIRDDEISLTLQQDFDPAEVDATLWPLFENSTVFPVHIRPETGAISASNPEYRADVVLLEYSPLSGKPGDLSETKIKLGVQGVITRHDS